MPTKTKLYNPLDDYNSYSIHYVMLATRTSQDAKDFSDDTKNTETLAAIEKTTALGEAIQYGGRKDVAFLVMDTRRFSQFSIAQLKYEALINGLEKGQSPGNIITTVEMTIIDSVGISFFNFLQWLMEEKMKCNFDGMIYMLRVIFVGHLPDGTTTTVQTITLPLSLLKLEVNLDSAKGEYKAEFMPFVNFDAKKNARWLNIGKATQYISSDATLGTMVNNFEAALNKQSKDYYDAAGRVLSDAKRATNDSGKYGRLVQYLITIPDDWVPMKIDSKSVHDANEIIHNKEVTDATAKAAAAQKSAAAKVETSGPAAQVGGVSTSTHAAGEAGSLVTEVLDRMFRMTPEIAKLGGGVKTGVGNGDYVTFYKFLLGISSDNDTVIVHVDVLKFLVPNIVIENDKKTKASQADNNFYQNVGGKRYPKSYMEFDYIFTGKNTTILNFDMKLQDLQWLLASNLEIGQGVMTAQSYEIDGKKVPIKTNAELVIARPYDALLVPKNTEDELKNFSSYSSQILGSDQGKEVIRQKQDWTRNLSAFYAASPITVIMTIKGNPLIMAKFAVSTLMDHAESTTAIQNGSSNSSSSKQAYRADLEKRIVKENVQTQGDTNVATIRTEGDTIVVNTLGDASYATFPVFVKVNIAGPNVDFKTNELVAGQNFSKEILTDNFYVVMKVTNLIEGSTFTQDLELFSHNIFGVDKRGSETPTSTATSIA